MTLTPYGLYLLIGLACYSIVATMAIVVLAASRRNRKRCDRRRFREWVDAYRAEEARK